MLEFLVQFGWVFKFVEFAIHFYPLIAILQEFSEFLAILPFPATDDGREQVQSRAFRQVHRAVDHLADGLAFDGQAGRGRIRNADARPEQAHIVVNLCHRADGGARVAAGCFLLDGDGGRKAFNTLDVGLLHQFQELARIGRQALHIAALALGIDRVERQRGFARAGQAGHHDKLAAWDVHVDIFQIVFLGAAHADEGGLGHFRSSLAGTVSVSNAKQA